MGLEGESVFIALAASASVEGVTYYEFLRELFILLSLATTIPTLGAGFSTILLYWREALEVWRKPAEERSRDDWLILGINTSFFGSVVDNIYWGIAWMAVYYSHPLEDALFAAGVFSNLFARQAATAYAGMCHIRAAGPKTTLPYIMGVSVPWVVSFFVAIALYATLYAQYSSGA